MTHATQPHMTAQEVMLARHSVKKYDASYQMPEADLHEILTLAAAAPSSWNLQHWKYLVITEQANKEKILPIAYGQKQVVEASATIVILGDLEANLNGPLVFDPQVEAGTLPQNVRDALIGQIEGAYATPSQRTRDEAVLNAGLSAMQLMLAAKALGYDTCPMGGFDKEQLVAALNIPARYIPVMLITVGKAATPAYPSPRFTLDQLIIQETF